MSKTLFAFLGLVLLMSKVIENDAWWLSSNRQPAGGSNPYYFGETDLTCMVSKNRKKRGAPSRSTLKVSHRWIFYRGKYFEWGVGPNDASSVGDSSVDSNICSTKRESSSAGYSNLSVNCIKKCTNSYESKYGKYNLIFNNCHHFTNRISEILYYKTSCPSWCQ